MTLEELVNQSGDLASLPDVCIRLNAGIDDPHFSATDLADILALDTALSSVLLRIVNSAFYSFSMPIETISRAITVVGINDLRNLIFAASAVDAFKNIASDLVDMNDFWVHSLYTAVSARCLAKQYSVLHPERLFVVGLLHDVGRLLMFHYLPKASSEVLMRTVDEPDLVPHVEKDVFGYTHAQVGAALLEKWRLPKNIVLGVAHHHQLSSNDEGAFDQHIIYMANKMTSVLERGESVEQLMATLDFNKMVVPELSEQQMDDLIKKIPSLFAESKTIITPMAI